ncbi:HXXEE domain-containing protein [Puerhibacterium puerhi]|uniref:HXXEE domain-containing protein n=1 Tax=Puerhibacterium puerhi TaxID=2692623 RepID=UPI001F2692E9|nr:HXXEE domain-containing protein [Puerhibacterium puerhi]
MKRWQAAGLLASWLVHDAEEWFAVGPWARARAADPRTPAVLRRAVGDRQQRSAIVAMGVLVAVATVDGVRTRGRSRLFHDAVLAYGLHGLGHLGAAVAVRGYAPGVATTPVVVLPYAAWALRRTRSLHGRARPKDVLAAAALVPLTIGAAHGVGALLGRRADAPPAPVRARPRP